MPDSLEYEKVIYTNEDKGYQLKLTVSEFREKYYVNIRKYFLSYESEYIPSKEGISMEASITNIFALLTGLMDICAEAEVLDAIQDLTEKYTKNALDS